MVRTKDYMIPIVIVLSIFAVWLSLQYLPTSVFGTVWAEEIAPMLWTYLPWLIILAFAMFTLIMLVRKK